MRRKYLNDLVMFYSQAGQDKEALRRFGWNGFFVDIGAYDGIESSNTFALEQAGWGGLCVEPNKEAFGKLVRNRSSINVNVAAHFYNGDTQFDGMRTGAVGETVQCRTLTDILQTNHAPAIIDYLSIDVEGAEMAVLKGMDFIRYHVRMITIEHNAYLEGPGRQEQIFNHLTAQGFNRSHKDVKCLDPNYIGAIYEDWYENINDKPKG